MGRNIFSLRFVGLFSLFIVSFFLPSVIFVVFHSSSLWLGVFISSALNVLITFLLLKRGDFFCRKDLLFFLVPFFVVLLDVVFVSRMEEKSLFSLIWFFCFFSAMQLGKVLSKETFENIFSAIFMMLCILFLIGWMKIIFGINWGNYSLFPKSVIPFSEESHFSLAVGAFLIPVVMASKSIKLAVFVMVNALLMSLLFPSLTLMVFCMIAFIIFFLKIRNKYFKLFVAFCVFVFLCFLLFSNNDSVIYFRERLDFRGTNNITTLVFIQGWSFAYNNFIHSNGVGLGFQMLGGGTTYLSDITYFIRSMACGYSLNLYDGGFLCSKIIAEFGVMGIVVSCLYIFLIANIVINFSTRSKVKSRKLIFHGVLVSFLVEYFLRGYGYFSPGVFLSISVFYSLYLLKNVSKEKD